MLEHEETMELIRAAQAGDNAAKAKLVDHNSPLIKSIIRRYRNKGADYDDLFQLGCIGFLKAIKNFDATFNVRFSTYAVPMIAGEVKRFLRDDGYIKVSRALKLASSKINFFIERYKKENFCDPPLDAISKEFNMEPQEIVYIMDSAKLPVSIYEKSDDQDDRSKNLLDKLATDDNHEELLERLILKDIIAALPRRDRKIIILRYFRDKTQSEIAAVLGVSQVQVSRLEAKIIEKIRAKLAPCDIDTDGN